MPITAKSSWEGAAVAVEGLIEEGGAQAGVEAFDAEEGLGGAGFSLGGTGSSGLGGVGSVGGELSIGDAFGHGSFRFEG
jgi:hypothetical protein